MSFLRVVRRKSLCINLHKRLICIDPSKHQHIQTNKKAFCFALLKFRVKKRLIGKLNRHHMDQNFRVEHQFEQIRRNGTAGTNNKSALDICKCRPKRALRFVVSFHLIDLHSEMLPQHETFFFIIFFFYFAPFRIPLSFVQRCGLQKAN